MVKGPPMAQQPTPMRGDLEAVPELERGLVHLPIPEEWMTVCLRGA